MMYGQCSDRMVRAGVAKKRIEPAWIDDNGNACDESQAYGCKVTHDLIHPDWCLVGDEVGENISMKYRRRTLPCTKREGCLPKIL